MARRHTLYATSTALAAALSAACGPEGTTPPPPNGPLVIDLDADVDASPDGGAGVGSAYALVPEWAGPCARSDTIDVDLGNSAASFVNAAYCQINGTMPSSDTVSKYTNLLQTEEYVRRVDVVRQLCQDAARACTLTYSNPWQTTVLETDPCMQKTSRDVGAVMMFFFDCPLKTNCTMDWANTHAWGMQGSDVTYGFGAQDPTGYYSPDNPGFWLRELLDARYAGLRFVLPNEYGNDVGSLVQLEEALTTLDGMGGGVQVGLFDDTSLWGKPAGGAAMNPAPNLSDSTAAQTIYDVKWKPFFTTISKAHWYTINGAPLIYFYYAGTLGPTSGADGVVKAMKALFKNDFGVTPFVDVDRGFCPTPCANADAEFVWDTFSNDPGTNFNMASTTGGLNLANAMVKWDSLGRDSPGAIATSTTRMHKGPEILQSVLQNTSSANLLLLETWNDLGEGTGITRNYDYYYQGQWQTPDAFMKVIRSAQCSN